MTGWFKSKAVKNVKGQSLSSALLENFAGRKGHTQLCVNRARGSTGILRTKSQKKRSFLCQKIGARRSRGRAHTIGKLSFPSCLPTRLLGFLFLSRRSAQSLILWPPSLPKALGSRVQNTPGRNRRF